MIGTEIVYSLDYMNEIKKLNLRLVLVVRDKVKAKEKFAQLNKNGLLEFIEGSMEVFQMFMERSII